LLENVVGARAVVRVKRVCLYRANRRDGRWGDKWWVTGGSE